MCTNNTVLPSSHRPAGQVRAGDSWRDHPTWASSQLPIRGGLPAHLAEFVTAAQQHTESNQHYRAAIATGGRHREKRRQLRAEISLLASACGVQTTYWEAVLDTICGAVAEAEKFAHVAQATKLLPVHRSECLAAFFPVNQEDPGTPPSKRARGEGNTKNTAIELLPLVAPPAPAAAAALQIAATQPTPSFLSTDLRCGSGVAHPTANAPRHR